MGSRARAKPLCVFDFATPKVYDCSMNQRSATTSGQQQRVVGKPWPKGVSGNPEGGRVKGPRYTELYTGIADDYGGEACLTTLQRAVLGQGVRLLIKAEKTRNVDLAVRLSNAAARMLAGMQHGAMNVRKAAPKKPPPSLDEHLKRLAEGTTP